MAKRPGLGSLFMLASFPGHGEVHLQRERVEGTYHPIAVCSASQLGGQHGAVTTDVLPIFLLKPSTPLFASCLRAAISVFKMTAASIFCLESRGRKAPLPAGFDVLNLLLKGDTQMPSCTSGLGTLSSKLTPQRQAVGAGAGQEPRRKTLFGTVSLESVKVQL